MKNQNITLEILVRSGDTRPVAAYATKHQLDEKKTEEKVCETALYDVVNNIRDDWSEVDVDGIHDVLQHPQLTRYFNQTQNAELMCEIVNSLETAIHSVGEDAPYLLAISVLGVPALARAIQRTVTDPKTKNTINDLITECYQVVFSASANNLYFLDHYLPLLKPWQDCVDQVNLVKTVLQNFAEENGLLEYDYKKEFFYAAIDSLIELFGRQYISECIADVFKESEDEETYKQLLSDKKVDAVKQKLKTKPSKIAKALGAYEEDWPNKHAVQQLEQKLGGKGQQDVARRLGSWFSKGAFRHVSTLINHTSGTLYDHKIAREELRGQIIIALANEDYKKLTFALELPEHLIDKESPTLKDFIAAYNIYHATKKEK